MKKLNFIAFILTLCMCLSACGPMQAGGSLWDSATYTEDGEFGEGATTFTVRVEAEEKSVVFTIHTDAKTVGEALKEHHLVYGENSAYGLYIKKVNGMEADYAKTQTYWAFNKDGAEMPTGVDSSVITDGDSYELVCTKGQ